MRATNAPAFPQCRSLMRIGVYYYPEAWPSNQWRATSPTSKISTWNSSTWEEFAWAFMEPEEGKFDFSWLDRNIQLCADQD